MRLLKLLDARLRRDLLAGGMAALTAVAVVLTLGLLAFSSLGAAAARVGITAAFTTAIVGALVYAWRGSAAAPAGGPSSATAVILAGLVAQLARDPQINLATATGLSSLIAVAAASVVLMGALQIVLGLLGLGRLARFVPQPVLAGFMNGVALMILLSQLPPLLGLPPSVRLGEAGLWSAIQPLTLAIGLTTAAVVWLLGWKLPRAPAPLLALLIGTVLYNMLAAAWPGVPLGPVVGPVPHSLMLPDALLPFAGAEARALFQRHTSAVLLTAVVLAVIGSLESLLTAVALDQLAHHRHDPRRELLALGAANIVSGACGGLALVQVRSRAMLLIKAHAPGRRAAVIVALASALMYALGGPLLALLPKMVLAGIMLTIAVALLDSWTHQLLRQLHSGERSADLGMSLAVVAVVCAVTLAWGFVAGVMAGVLLSMLVFIRSMNRSLLRGRFSAAQRPSRRIYGPAQEALLHEARRRITLLELEGALFFGSAARLAAEVETLPADGCCLVLDFRRVSTIDESGAVLLQQLEHKLRQRGQTLLMAGVAADNAHGQRLRAFGCFRHDPRPDWLPDVDHAIEAAERQLLAEAGITAPQAAVPLAQTSLLRDLTPAQSARVQSLLQTQPLPAGTLLFREGDPGDRLYVLTQGSISIVSGSAQARQRYVSYSPGVMFGEIAMLDGGKRSADAMVDSDSVVHALTREAFDTLRGAEPALGERLMRNIALHLSERLRSAAMAWRASAA